MLKDLGKAANGCAVVAGIVVAGVFLLPILLGICSTLAAFVRSFLPP